MCVCVCVYLVLLCLLLERKLPMGETMYLSDAWSIVGMQESQEWSLFTQPTV